VLEGGLLGAILVRYLPEVLGLVQEFRMVIFGLLLVLMLIYLPEGIGGYFRDNLR
jgi:branched-chain amino acid transport system permease protein